MTDDPILNRRRLLELTSVGTGMAVAGCMNQVDDSATSGGDSNSGDSNSRQVTMSVQVDQQEIIARQQELLQEVQTGNKTQQEARSEIQTLQQEAAAEAIDSAESELESSALTIDDQISTQGQGILLVSGPDGAILDMLETDVIQAIASSSLFDQARTAQQQQQQAQQQQQGQ